jgi:hypothetical protein
MLDPRNAGCGSLVARKVRSLEVSGSIRSPATKLILVTSTFTRQNKSCYPLGWILFRPRIEHVRPSQFPRTRTPWMRMTFSH